MVTRKYVKQTSIAASPGTGSVVVTPILLARSPIFREKRKLSAPCESESGSTEFPKKMKLSVNEPTQQQEQLRKGVPMGMHLTLALLQFLWGLTFGTIKPFLPIWLRYKGLSTVEIGLVQTVGVFGQLLSPVFGLILDYVQLKSLITMLLCLADAGLGAAIWLSPDSFVKTGEASTSWAIYFFAFFAYGFLQVVTGIFDTMNLDWGTRSHFGTYKMFCGVGWGISSALIGYYGEGPKISIMFPAMVVCCLLMAFIALILTCVRRRNPPMVSDEPGVSIISQLKVFFASLDKKSYFVITNFLMGGASFAGIQLYLFLWLQDLGGSNFLMGLTMVITIVGEVPCFYVYVTVLKRLGPTRILGLGSTAYIIRMMWYTLLGVGKLQSPWYVFVVEMLHGLTFAWIFGSCSVYAYLISPPEIRNTAVQFLNSVYMGAGGVLGSLVGGVIYQYGGGRAVFITLSVCMLPFAAYGLLSKADSMPADFFDETADGDEKTPLLTHTSPQSNLYSNSNPGDVAA